MRLQNFREENARAPRQRNADGKCAVLKAAE